MLVVENLSKKFQSFELKGVSFKLDKGYIMGFIGANGAGKSTTLKAMLGIIHPDGGKVTVLGRDFYQNQLELKQQIGLMLGPANYYSKSKVGLIAEVYKSFFRDWDESVYKSYLKKFNLDENKKIAELSAGMRVKLGITFALSHKAKLLILDEPTSGLDPLARDELLDVFQEIVEDGEHSILFSTHITSDLDKCADFIIFMRNGEILLSDTKDNIIDAYAVVKGANGQLAGISDKLIGVKKNHYGFSGLIKKEMLPQVGNLLTERPNLEDIMVYYNKGGETK